MAACKPKAFPLYVKFSATVRAYKGFLCNFFAHTNRINVYAHMIESLGKMNDEC